MGINRWEWAGIEGIKTKESRGEFACVCASESNFMKDGMGWDGKARFVFETLFVLTLFIYTIENGVYILLTVDL